jgi:hypothetical protein
MLIADFETAMKAWAAEDKEMAARIVKGSGLGPLISLEEGEARLDEITIDDGSTDWAASELLSATALAERLQISPATLDAWRTANKAVAFLNDAGGHIYPARQFEGTAPIEGLDRVVTLFPSLDEAWEWLVTPCRYTNDEAPIDRLRSKHVNEVVRAAEGVSDFQWSHLYGPVSEAGSPSWAGLRREDMPEELLDLHISLTKDGDMVPIDLDQSRIARDLRNQGSEQELLPNTR